MAFQRQNSVQQKIDCVFEIKVENKASSKRQDQPFRVLASNKLNPSVTEHDLEKAKATEKLDGTCCYIAEYEGKPWLWARHDRKPNKVGEKKLKRHKSEKVAWREGGEEGDKPTIVWDVVNDFKDVPEKWKPALDVPIVDGVPQPDSQGHIPGWVPVDPRGRQHLWHLSAVDLNQGLGLVLRQLDDGSLCVDCVPLADIIDTTVELIGTNVNANPYKLGTKQQPVHVLVIHGAISVNCPPPFDRDTLIRWMEEEEGGQVEGVVWHLSNGSLFKLHRHHVNLRWPIDNPRLSQCKVKVNVDGTKFEFKMDERCQFYLMSRHFQSTCDQLCHLHDLIYSAPENKAWKYTKKFAPFVAGAVLLPAAVPVVLGVAGFGAGGIVAGSLAARAMSAAAIANGGGVAAGGAVAVCQSIGAAGLSTAGTAAVSAAGAGIVGIGKGIASLFRRRENTD